MRLLLSALLALALSTGGLGLYAKHLRGEVAERDALVVAQQETIAGLKADVAERDQNVAALRTSRDTVNARLIELIAENNAAVDAEVARRKAAAAERDKAKSALRIALDTLASTSNEDETCDAWLRSPAPQCAWGGLRDAATKPR